jgi:hypothetical protein
VRRGEAGADPATATPAPDDPAVAEGAPVGVCGSVPTVAVHSDLCRRAARTDAAPATAAPDDPALAGGTAHAALVLDTAEGRG